MSCLDIAMQKHMAHIVKGEGRSFTYFDFLDFEVDGVTYGMKHGTFRNKISQLIRSKMVEVHCYSVLAFYTLKGHRVGKSVTGDPRVTE